MWIKIRRPGDVSIPLDIMLIFKEAYGVLIALYTMAAIVVLCKKKGPTLLYPLVSYRDNMRPENIVNIPTLYNIASFSPTAVDDELSLEIVPNTSPDVPEG